MSMQTKKVVLTRDIIQMGRASIPAGLGGRVVWDEGGDDVIVEFGQEVPNEGLLPDQRQAWIPRNSLTIE